MILEQYHARCTEYLPATTIADVICEMVSFHREGVSINGFLGYVYGRGLRSVSIEIYKSDLCDFVEPALDAIDQAEREFPRNNQNKTTK